MKALKPALTIVVFLITHLIYAQLIGQPFPDMETETVEDEIINLPKDKLDKYTLVGLAHSKKSEDDLNTWFSPVYHKFIKKEQGGMFAGFGYDVNVYFIPMFTGAKAAGQGTAKRKAAKEMDERLLPHILFYKGKLDPYKDALQLEEKDTPYFFVIDKDGNIIHATSGAYSDDKMDEIESVLEEE